MPHVNTQHRIHCRLLIKGGGEMASGVALCLYRAGFREILILENEQPTAVRRTVSFCEAVYNGEQQVEGVSARLVRHIDALPELWQHGIIAVATDPVWRLLPVFRPQISIDAILAKRNLGTKMDEAPFVLALGPGFTAGVDAHAVIETQRGHNLGRAYTEGAAEANSGIPGSIAGYTRERVLRSPADGFVTTFLDIGDTVRTGDAVLSVNGISVRAEINGVVRGLIRPGIMVSAGTKVGDIDPRANTEYCRTVSEKARSLGGAVLEAVCAQYHMPRTE